MSAIVVIGATAAGMSTAMRLAVKHHDVTVIDAQQHAGGLLLGHERDGLAFDTGAITLPAIFRDLFLKTGAPLEDELDLQPIHIAREHQFADGTSVRLPGAGVGLSTHAIGDALGNDASAQWTAFMTAAADEWAAGRQEAWHAKSTDAIIAGSVGAPVLIGRRNSMETTIRRHLRDARLRALARDIATSLGVDARHAPVSLITRPYVEQSFGILHIGGGRRRLAQAIATRAKARGVQIRLGVSILDTHTRHDGRHRVELDDGTMIEADAIVHADSSASLYAQSFTDDPAVVPPHRMRWRRSRSASSFTIFAAVDSMRPNAHLTTWHSPDPARTPTITVCAPDDPAMRDDAHPGLRQWAITAAVPPHGDGRDGTVDWTAPDRAPAFADQLLASLADAGTDIRPQLRWMDTRTPADQ